MSFKITSNNFKLNNKDIFIYSGEIHYFRISKDLWPLHIKRLKEAGCNTISTYIPWSWHEYKDNEFDFTGKTHPKRDLIYFLDLCRKNNLLIILKPGPYILAEYIYHGLPEWLFKKHPEIHALASTAAQHPMHMATLMHPVFLKYVKRWYKNIMPIINKYKNTKDSGVIMMQLCNEIAFYYWISAEGDYNQVCIKFYHKYLKKRYKKISNLNKIYKSKNKKFDNVKPPSGEVVSKEGFIRYQDWHLFYRGYYVEYLFYLLKLVRKLGLDIPVFHNLPGWIDGKAAEYPVNVIMYDKLIDKTSEIMLGVDHIPEFVDFRNLSDDYICNEITQTVQKRKFPSFGIEVQSGSRHHRTRVYCNDLELFYKACLVHGLKGMNLYMFSQGINPNKKGSLGKTFYWQTPLDVKGNKSKYYNVVEKMGKLIDVHGENLIKTHRKAQTAVGIYRPYYYTEFTIPAFGNRKMNVYDIGLDYDPQQIRNMILYDGVMRALKVLSHDFNLEDLQHINLGDLLKYKQLWVVSLDYMDEKTQKKLALYVKKGGHLIIMPTLPDKDLNLKRCNFLYQEFKVERKEVVFPDFPKMDIYDVKDFSCLNRINIYDNKDSEIIARTSDDKCCGINKKIDKGKLSLLGTGFTYELSEHLEAFRKLLNTDNFRKDVISSNDQLITGLLYGKDYNYLYLLNYHRDSQQVYLKLNSNKDNNNKIRIPHIGKMEVPSTYGLIIPINLTLSKDIRLRYTTSEILTVDSRKNQLRLEIDGAAQIPGQMQFLSQKKVKNVTIDGKKIKISKKDGYNFIFYRHLDKTRHLNIRLS